MMNREMALAFLRQHQPMPPEPAYPQESEYLYAMYPDDSAEMRAYETFRQLMQQYNAVRMYFQEHPDPECIPLFLNSFGSGNGLGIYQIVVEVLERFSHEEVVPHLLGALVSESADVRIWAREMTIVFSSPELIEPLQRLLLHDTDENIRYFAAGALRNMDDERAVGILQQALRQEQSPAMHKQIRECIEENQKEFRK